MDDKKNALLTSAVIFTIILFFTVADFFGEDRLYSATENRILASKPTFGIKTLLQGVYAEDYEAYVTDQFTGRDKWITMKTGMDILFQKKSINGVYLGKDGYLIEQHMPEDYTLEMEEEALALLDTFVQRWDARVMLVPTADNIITDKLPGHAVYYDETRLLSQVKEMVGGYQYIDVCRALQEHADEEIYYRTDHHWTSLGAYYGYIEWAGTVHRYPLIRDAEQRETVTETFLGTLHSRINLSMQGEKIQYFPDTEEIRVEITYDFGRTTDTFYEENYLETKNKYGYFLDDNHAFIEIHTGCRNGKTLFVVKDSYANCMIPLLAQHYETVYVMDLRYFNGKLFDFMERYEPEKGMDVLVLYNCIHFLENFRYIQ